MKIEREDNISCYSMVEEKRLSTNIRWPKQDFVTILDLAFPGDCYVEFDSNPVLDELYIG